MVDKKEYRPQSIPPRGEGSTGVSSQRLSDLPNLPTFAELRIASELIPENMATSQPITEPADDVRGRFYAMRKIATEQLPNTADRSVVFYRQALFMQDFEDDYPYKEHFSAHFPYYQLMGYGQLRCYFSWRTKIRRGIVERTSLSYAFLYIYELINNVGVIDPQEGLDKLMAFWGEYRKFTDRLDEYVFGWLKDYHIYYPLKQSFLDFTKEHNFQQHYPTIFAYHLDRENSLHIFNNLSSYKIVESRFFTDENEQLISACFHHILTKIQQMFEVRGDRFERLFLYRYSGGNIFIPFNHAIFYPHLTQSDRKTVLSDGERYSCVENRFYFYTASLSKMGERMLGYILKEMESTLRNLVGFRHKIKAVKNDCDFRLRDELLKVGIELPNFVITETREFYRLYTRKEVKVDISRLARIRSDALQTQNSLIVPEDIPELAPIPMIAVEPQQKNGFEGFVGMLSETEHAAIKLVLEGKSIKPFAIDKGVMLEVLIDEINQKASDSIGDTLIELDVEPIIYDDYIEDLKEVLK